MAEQSIFIRGLIERAANLDRAAHAGHARAMREAARDLTNLSSKIAQLYQILGDRLMGDPSPASDAEIQRALDYAADTDRFDPDFLPWPKPGAEPAGATDAEKPA